MNEVQALGAASRAIPAQNVRARLLAQANDTAPSPGTRRLKPVEEHPAAYYGLEPGPAQLKRLNDPTPPRAHGMKNQHADIDR
jgi:hypothetical protein